MFKIFLVSIISLTIIISCEAPLNLEGVEQQAKNAFQRSDRLQDIVANESVQVVVGSFGIILLSKDNGQNWSRQQLASQPTLIDLVACPNNDLVAISVEGSIWRSTDNGVSWIEKSLGSEEIPQATDCAPDGTIWVVSSFSTFLNSSDNGKTWSSLSLDKDLILSYVKFFTPMKGIATGEFGSLFTTLDGGISWNAQNPIPNEFYPIASYFTSEKQGWVAGLSGKIIQTSDGGNTWVTEITPSQIPLYSLSGNGRQVYAVGALGTILVKDITRQDQDWHLFQYDNPTRGYLRGIMLNEAVITAVGGGGAFVRLSLSPSEKH